MKSLSHTESPDTHAPRTARAAAEAVADPDELIALARRHFTRDYPNTARDGCPPDETLHALVAEGRPPDKALRAHMLACSECFRVYNTAVISSEEKTLAARPWVSIGPFSLGRAPILAGLVAVMLLAGAGTYFWRRQQKEAGQLAPGTAPQDSGAEVSPT